MISIEQVNDLWREKNTHFQSIFDGAKMEARETIIQEMKKNPDINLVSVNSDGDRLVIEHISSDYKTIISLHGAINYVTIATTKTNIDFNDFISILQWFYNFKRTITGMYITGNDGIEVSRGYIDNINEQILSKN